MGGEIDRNDVIRGYRRDLRELFIAVGGSKLNPLGISTRYMTKYIENRGRIAPGFAEWQIDKYGSQIIPTIKQSDDGGV